MGSSKKRFIPLATMPAAEPHRLSPVWMYSASTRTEINATRPSMNGSDRAPEVNRLRSSSDDGSSDGVDYPLAATTTEAGRRRKKFRSRIESRWAWVKKHRKPLLLLVVFGSIFIAVVSFIASLTQRSSSPPVATPAPAPAPPPPPASPYFKAAVTWNNYTAQPGVVCGHKLPANSTHFGAAASDISPEISGGKCAGTIDLNICNKTTGEPPPKYQGPSCPRTNCGFCYRLYSLGPIDGSSPIQNISTFPPPPTPRSLRGLPTASVQIIDSCPASNANNYCKAFSPVLIPADQRCGDPEVNTLDVDTLGWGALSGLGKNASVEEIGNIWVWGEKVSC